jgi:rhomboid protease GluP
VRQAIYAGPDALASSPVTRTIIFACIVVFVGEVLASRSLHSLISVPLSVEVDFGANDPRLSIEMGHVERLLSSCFLHTSLLHIAVNMYTLRQVGPLVEPTVGSGRYATMFVLTGLAGSLASAFMGELLGHPVASVGASGAICGVMGAAVVVGARVDGWRSGIAWQIGFWLLVNLALGLEIPGIDNAAHVGGLLGGCAIAALWRRGVTYSPARTAVAVGASALLCLASGAVVAWRDRTDPYSVHDWNARSRLVGLALERGDCVGARRALLATEALGEETPELEGLRRAVDETCPK